MMAQDGEVALLFQPLLGLAANFLGSHESQVADPMIEAQTRVRTVDGELGAIFKRWYPDMDLEVEEISVAA